MDQAFSKIKPHSEVVFTKLSDGEGILLNLQTKLYYSLNSTGSFLWQLIEKNPSLSVSDLGAKLLNHYQIPQNTAIKDTNDFIQDLTGEGLLEFC